MQKENNKNHNVRSPFLYNGYKKTCLLAVLSLERQHLVNGALLQYKFARIQDFF